jgi:U3 small nucleolar RNA-associated protein 24
MNPNDKRLKTSPAAQIKNQANAQKKDPDAEKRGQVVQKTHLNNWDVKKLEKEKVCMFFQANMNLGPPYHIIVDTNFINFSIQHKMDIFQSMLDCLLAKCIPCVTDCCVAELEKMGHRYRLALKLTKDPRFKRLRCAHRGTYADDCLVDRVKQHKCYIVATNDKDLKRRIRKVPGVPIMYLAGHKYQVERMMDDLGNL